MKTITKEFSFDSSHRLIDNHLSEAENKSVYGKCFEDISHGHRWQLFVTVSGDMEHGMIMNFNELKEIVNKKIINVFDHHFINNIDIMKNIIPTCENMIDIFWIMLDDSLQEYSKDNEHFICLEKLKLYETPTSYCELVRD